MAIHDSSHDQPRRRTPEEQRARALELARKTELKPFDLRKALQELPPDWDASDWDVDEFLAVIRRPEEASR